MLRRIAAVSLVVLASIAVGGASGRSEAGRLPAPVTLEGVAGVVPGLTAEQMWKVWRVRFPVLRSAEGSSNVDYAPICAGLLEGVAIFLSEELVELRFYRGALTDKKVGNGATVAQLRRAYGRSLRRSGPASGRVYRLVSTSAPKNAIAFGMKQGRVATVEFGRPSALGKWGEIYGVRC